MRVKVILNPWSDRGRAIQRKAQIEAYGRQHGQLDVVVTQGPGDGRRLAEQAAEEGYDVIVAAGGDGTIHEVVNGLVASQKPIPFGVLPIGSGNDFAFGQGISTNLETAVAQLFHGQPVWVDLARIEDDNGRSLVADNNIGIGFDATVVIETQRFKRIYGFLLYLTAVLRTILFHHIAYPLQCQFDTQNASQKTLFLSFGLGPRSGGGFFITPQAKNNDNLIDSCMVHDVGRVIMLSMLTKVMKGTHITSPYVTMRQSQSITVCSELPLPIHVDGEVFAYPQDNIRKVTITSLPAAIQVIR